MFIKSSILGDFWQFALSIALPFLRLFEGSFFSLIRHILVQKHFIYPLKAIQGEFDRI